MKIEDIVAAVSEQRPSPPVSLDSAIEALAAAGFDRDAIREAMWSIIVRLVEVRALAHPGLLAVAQNPRLYLGRVDAIVEEELGKAYGLSSVPRGTVAYISQCLQGRYARTGAKKGFSDFALRQLFVRARGYSNQLRCEICGYHFQEADLGPARLEICRDLGLSFSESHLPPRMNDQFKPYGDTKLEIDHVVPEVGFGWSDPENLRVTCSFCNQGRSIYRRPREAISLGVAASLCLASGAENFRLRRAVGVAAMESRGLCSSCGARSPATELTIRAGGFAPAPLWFVPWAVTVFCYDCV